MSLMEGRLTLERCIPRDSAISYLPIDPSNSFEHRSTKKSASTPFMVMTVGYYSAKLHGANVGRETFHLVMLACVLPNPRPLLFPSETTELASDGRLATSLKETATPASPATHDKCNHKTLIFMAPFPQH